MASSDKTKTRQDRVYGRVNIGEDRTLTVHYDPETDQVEIEGAEPGSTRTERSYARESGKPKIVASVPSAGKSAFAAKDALFAYEWVVAVDTNTKPLFGKKCGLCVSYFTPKPPASCDRAVGVPFAHLASYLMFGIREGVNPEQIGWHLTMTRNLGAPIPSSHQIAFVVDSELGSHPDINARKIGYYRDHLLPPQLTIGYSSSDTDNETLGGQMIRMCDQVASKLLLEVERLGVLPSNHLPGNDDFEALYAVSGRRQ
ncbi:hypothetical protein [Granulicella sp. S156]|uniref:hypothetical protein n=1 Tax=Granulicella sp. S156 TaxID=1747224 RepID=UPI00131AA3E0|nr:hypothetical protein [Granulicella sp. S156]